MSIRHAVILSAGKGSRLLPLTANRPKCLIEFSGRTLLDWQLDSLSVAGIAQVTIVTGFRPDVVEAAVAGRSGVTLRFNPFYHVADNLGSVWMVRDAFAQDTLLLNGDTLIPPALITRLIEGDAAPISVAVDEKDDYDADDMKVLREGATLRRIGKTLSADEYNAESIGMLRFTGEGRAAFVETVEQVMRTPEGTTSFLPAGNRSDRRVGHRLGGADHPGCHGRRSIIPPTSRSRAGSPRAGRKAQSMAGQRADSQETSAAICASSSFTASPNAGALGQPVSRTTTPSSSRSPS